MKIYDLNILWGQAIYQILSLSGFNYTAVVEGSYLAGSFASVGNAGLWPNASPSAQSVCASEQIPIITLRGKKNLYGRGLLEWGFCPGKRLSAMAVVE